MPACHHCMKSLVMFEDLRLPTAMQGLIKCASVSLGRFSPKLSLSVSLVSTGLRLLVTYHPRQYTDPCSTLHHLWIVFRPLFEQCDFCSDVPVEGCTFPGILLAVFKDRVVPPLV